MQGKAGFDVQVLPSVVSVLYLHLLPSRTLKFGIVRNFNTFGIYFPRDNKTLILLFAIALAEISSNYFMNHAYVIISLYNNNLNVIRRPLDRQLLGSSNCSLFIF